MTARAERRREDIRTCVIGYAATLILTGAAFALVERPFLATTTTLAFLLGLALLQMIVHFRYFLHVGFGEASRDSLRLIAFSSVIVILMVGGTLIVLSNLRERMM